MSQQTCTAALICAKNIPHCSSAKQAHSRLVSLQSHLWRFALHAGVQGAYITALQHWSGQNAFSTVQWCSAKRFTAGLCHCNHTYGNLLFMQVCSEPTDMHCSTDLCKKHSPLFFCKTGSQQACVTAITPMEIRSSCRCAGSLQNCTAALVWAKSILHCSVVLCKTGSQQACVTAITPMEIRSSCRCAGSLHNCTAALVWAKCILHCSVVLCKTGSQQVCVTAITPMEICSSCRCAVSQQKCTAALICAKNIPHCSSAKQAHSRLVSLQLHLWRFALHAGVQGAYITALQHWSGQNAFSTVQWCSAKQVHSRFVSLQSHLWKFALHAGVQ